MPFNEVVFEPELSEIPIQSCSKGHVPCSEKASASQQFSRCASKSTPGSNLHAQGRNYWHLGSITCG